MKREEKGNAMVEEVLSFLALVATIIAYVPARPPAPSVPAAVPAGA